MDLVVWEVSMDYVVRDDSDDSLVIQVLGVSEDVLLLFFAGLSGVNASFD